MKKLILAGLLISQSLFAANLDVTKDILGGRVTYRVDKQKNETTQIDGEGFSIVLKDVNDYRCPQHMACFDRLDNLWEGAISVSVEVTQNNINEASIVVYQDDRPAVIELLQHKLIISNIIKYAEDNFQITLISVPL